MSNPHAREKRHASREDLDWFRTEPWATRALLDREVFPGTVWECACGDGAMSRVIEAAGYQVFSTDLVDRGFGIGRRDFLMETQLPEGVASVITNPPFKLATEFVRHAIELGARKVAVLCRVAFLEGVHRGSTIFADSQCSRVWVFSDRLTLWRGDLESERSGNRGAMAFAWFVFEQHHRGPTVGWIGKEARR